MNDEAHLRAQIQEDRPLVEGCVDDRPEVAKLLATIKAALPELEKLRDECAGRVDEDAVYRFYHQSNKLYGRCQIHTEDIVAKLRSLAPDPSIPLDPYFEEIVRDGKQSWDISHNQEWTKHTRPILEAFFHARYFLDMLIAYAHELDEPPGLMGYGWAAILTLYGLR
jgi:hypothetical protein